VDQNDKMVSHRTWKIITVKIWIDTILNLYKQFKRRDQKQIITICSLADDKLMKG